MMPLNHLRHSNIFDPTSYDKVTNIIGVGGVGSEVGRMVTKLGVGENEPLHIWDFDRIESHNVGNQAYDPRDVGQIKVGALARHMRVWSGASTKVKAHRQKVVRKIPLTGVVFLCLDSMAARKNICEQSIFNNPDVSLCIETRMDARSAQAYVFDPNDQRHIELWQAFWYPDDKTVNTVGCGGHSSIITAVSITAAIAVQSLVDWTAVKDVRLIPNYLTFDLKTWTFRSERWALLD